MSSVVRPFLGAALLLMGASAAVAQSAAPVANQAVQTNTSTTTVASTTTTAAPAAEPAPKPRSTISDNNDPYGGHDPNSSAGARAFFVPQY